MTEEGCDVWWACRASRQRLHAPGGQGDMIVFGPVPSRRLGKSLGINNIPPKGCSYSCVYCQVGRTVHPMLELREFYPIERIVAEVSERVGEIRDRGE